MSTKRLVIILFIIAILVVVGIYIRSYVNDKNNPPAPQNTNQTSIGGWICQAKTQNSILAVGQDSTKGNYYTDSHCRTLYTFKKDTNNVSACDATCAKTWLPYYKSAEVSDDISSDVTSFTRADGRVQYALKGQPLYFYSDDKRPGDKNGDGLNGNWNVIRTNVTVR